MSVLVVAPGRDVSHWVETLKSQHPGMNVYVYPEDHDNEEVEVSSDDNNSTGEATNSRP